MKSRISLPILFALSLAPAVASTEDGGAEDGGAEDAGLIEMLPFLGPVPEAPSKPPKPAEWAAAPEIIASHHTHCGVRRVREWLRVRCEIRSTTSIEVVAGTGKDVYFSILPGRGTCHDDPHEGQICYDQDEVVFPLRRGDRRFIQFSRLNLGNYMGPPSVGAVHVSEVWLEGDPAPVVSIDSSLF